MSLLSICQAVGDEIGERVPSTIVSNTSPDGRRWEAIANRAGKDLMKAHNWRALVKEQTYTASGAVSSATIAAIFTGLDFDRFIDETWWDRTNDQPMQLATSNQWQQLQSGVVTLTGIRTFFYQRGKTIYFEPDLADGTVIAAEYISNKWVENSGASAQYAAFNADTDLPLIDENLLILNMRWRYLRAKRRAYDEEKLEYLAELKRVVARDGGRATLRPRGSGFQLPPGNMPEGNFG